MDDKCIICGEVIPEGRYVCIACESGGFRAPDISKVTKGLMCCSVAFNDDDPFARCAECPYDSESIIVDDCRAVLNRDALKVIMGAEIRRCIN